MKKKSQRKKIVLLIVLILLCIIWLPFLLERPGPLPPGTHCGLRPRGLAPHQVTLLIDETARATNQPERVVRQTICDAVLDTIADAHHFIVADFFLWIPWQGSSPEEYRALSTELAEALIAKKQAQPTTAILVMTDPINRCYDDDEPAYFHAMAEAGITVVFTDLGRLRDSNRLYSCPARFYGKPLSRLFSTWFNRPRYKNILDSHGAEMTARQVARMLHFKANHRKVLIADDDKGDLKLLVSSFNPADAASAHSNMGLLIRNGPARDALDSELNCIAWSAEAPAHVLGGTAQSVVELANNIRTQAQSYASPDEGSADAMQASWLTEGAIRNQILHLLNETIPGDVVRIAMFYLADEGIVRALQDAAESGTDIRLILDANHDAFGHKKTGVPNRVVAADLEPLSHIKIRWADTHGEQFHDKAMSITNPDIGKYEFICGSANWTRRNIGDFNMEADVFLERAPDIVAAFNAYFDRCWNNDDGLSHTLPYDAMAESGWSRFIKTLLYHIQEPTGMGTF